MQHRAFFFLLALTTTLPACGLVKVNGAEPGTPGTTRTSAAGGGLETETELTTRFCGELANRMKPVEAKLDEARREKDAKKQLALFGQAHRSAREIERALQPEFDAEYQAKSRAALKANVASTPGYGYGSSSNGNHLQLTETSIAALAGGAGVMAASGLPFAKDEERGILAGDVNILGSTACETPKRKEHLATLAANVQKLPKTIDLGNAVREEPPAVKAGDLVKIGGGVVKAGESPSIKLVGGRPVYNNCRPTNRFDHFDSNGVAHYEEACDYAGGREVTLTVVVKNVGPHLPPGTKLVASDYLGVVGRVVSSGTKVTTKGSLVTTAHVVEITPIAVVQTGHAGKETFAF